MSSRSLNYYAPSYAAIFGSFRNAPQLCWHHHRRTECPSAVFWNGKEFRFAPGTGGLCETVVEIWGLQPYTADGFYVPRDEDLIVDLGANAGAFSLWAASIAPRAVIIAVEPAQANVRAMRENLAGWQHRVDIRHCAVGASRGSGTLVDSVRSLDYRVSESAVDGGESVDILTLGDLLNGQGGKDIDFMKVDIEGAELDLFESMDAAILRSVRKIGLEYHNNVNPRTLAAVLARLEPTHQVDHLDDSAGSYGTLRATRRSAAGAAQPRGPQQRPFGQ